MSLEQVFMSKSDMYDMNGGSSKTIIDQIKYFSIEYLPTLYVLCLETISIKVQCF